MARRSAELPPPILDKPAGTSIRPYRRSALNPQTANHSLRYGHRETQIGARTVILQPWAGEDSTRLPSRLIFLDRDGVLVDLNDRYAITPEAVYELPGVDSAVSRLASAGFRAVVVTNQSGIGRGLVSEKQALDINAWILRKVDPGRRFIEFTLMCPHAPDDACSCRKPLTQGVERFINPVEALRGRWFVGDQMTDLQCAESLGMKPVLVRTGHGNTALRRVSELRFLPQIVTDFSAFADLALRDSREPSDYEVLP